MNRFKIAILILVVCVALSFASLCFIENSCGKMIDKLDEVIVHLAKKNVNGAIEKLDDSVEYFEKIKPFLNILEGQGETIEIRGDLNKAIFFMNAKNYESAILYIEECKTDLNRIIVSNIPSISTVL